MPRRDNNLAARALADAVLTNDRTAAAKHGITDRTLRRYREALETDPELSATFRATLDALLTEGWAKELDAGIRDLIGQLRRRSETLANTPEGYQALVDAVRALGEIAVAREVLNAAAEQDAAPAQAGYAAQRAALPN